jgi:hypothetical protein
MQTLVSILGRRRGRSEAVSWMWPDDARIPRWRIARGKRVREDLVHRLLGGKTDLCIAGFINDPVDSYDGRDDGCDAVAIFDCDACVEHDRSLRGLLLVDCPPTALRIERSISPSSSSRWPGDAASPWV